MISIRNFIKKNTKENEFKVSEVKPIFDLKLIDIVKFNIRRYVLMPNGLLAVTSGLNFIQLWDLSENTIKCKEQITCSFNVNSLLLLPDGNLMLGSGRTIYILNLKTKEINKDIDLEELVNHSPFQKNDNYPKQNGLNYGTNKLVFDSEILFCMELHAILMIHYPTKQLRAYIKCKNSVINDILPYPYIDIDHKSHSIVSRQISGSVWNASTKQMVFGYSENSYEYSGYIIPDYSSNILARVKNNDSNNQDDDMQITIQELVLNRSQQARIYPYELKCSSDLKIEEAIPRKMLIDNNHFLAMKRNLGIGLFSRKDKKEIASTKTQDGAVWFEELGDGRILYFAGTTNYIDRIGMVHYPVMQQFSEKLKFIEQFIEKIFNVNTPLYKDIINIIKQYDPILERARESISYHPDN